MTSKQRPYCIYEGCKEVCVDAENKRLSEFLQLWIYEGRLQSFEDRERFRKAAQALVSGTPSPDETSRDDAAFEAGWRAAAEWAKRDDLVHDIDSPAYRIDRFSRLKRLAVEPTVPNAHCNGCGQGYVATKGHVCPAVKASAPQAKCAKCGAPLYSAYCQCCGSPQTSDDEDDHGSPIVDDL